MDPNSRPWWTAIGVVLATSAFGSSCGGQAIEQCECTGCETSTVATGGIAGTGGIGGLGGLGGLVPQGGTGETGNPAGGTGGCGASASCSNDCEPGVDTRCLLDGHDHGVQICGFDGTWATGERTICPYVCTEAAGAAVCDGSCKPTAVECTDANHYRSCSDYGSWSATQKCTDGLSCFETSGQGACVDECHPGTVRCADGNDVGGAVQLCSATEVWTEADACSGDDEICVEGICAPNTGQPVGWSTTLPSAATFPSGFIYFIHLPALPATLESTERFVGHHVGLLPSESAATSVIVGLYGGTETAPQTLLAEGIEAGSLLGSTPEEIGLDVHAPLTEGEHYWVAVQFSGTASLGVDVGDPATIVYMTDVYGGAGSLPESIDAHATSTAAIPQAMNVWLSVVRSADEP